MHIVEIEADEALTVPLICCCCCAPVKGKLKYRTIAVGFAICKRCRAWIDAKRSARAWHTGFIVSAVLAGACIAGGIVFIRILAGILLLVGGAALLVLAVLAFLLSRKRQRDAREQRPGRGRSSKPVSYSGSIGRKHRFLFANEEYCREFKKANGILT